MKTKDYIPYDDTGKVLFVSMIENVRSMKPPMINIGTERARRGALAHERLQYVPKGSR